MGRVRSARHPWRRPTAGRSCAMVHGEPSTMADDLRRPAWARRSGSEVKSAPGLEDPASHTGNPLALVDGARGLSSYSVPIDGELVHPFRPSEAVRADLRRMHDELREMVLGLTAVTGAGSLMKAGARVVKNVAGYDLARLHHGARGAFGMILDMTVRLQARPETTLAVFVPCELDDVVSRLESMRRPAVDLDPAVQVWVNAAAARGMCQ